jgi:integrase
MTVAGLMRAWIDAQEGSLKTIERYNELASGQIYPQELGAILVHKLRPNDIAKWHTALRAGGAKDGSPLSARTISHAHKILRRALKEAVRRETLARNVADAIEPPKIDAEEVVILKPEEVDLALIKLEDHKLYAIAVLALATGMRRGKLLGLQIGDVDFDAATIKVERSLQETATGLRLKGPKSKHGRRDISLPPSALAILRAHWVEQLKNRMACGLGKARRPSRWPSTRTCSSAMTVLLPPRPRACSASLLAHKREKQDDDSNPTVN